MCGGLGWGCSLRTGLLTLLDEELGVWGELPNSRETPLKGVGGMSEVTVPLFLNISVDQACVCASHLQESHQVWLRR